MCVSANSQSGLYAIFCGQHPCFLLINILWFLWLTLMFSPQETQFFGAPSHQELEPRMINNDFVRVCLLVCFCSCLFLFLFVCFCMFLSNFCMVQYKFWCAFICAYLSSFQGSVFVLMLICVWICVNAYFPPHMALGDYCLSLFAFIFALGLAMGVSYFCLG